MVEEIDVTKMKELLAAGADLIDVRESEELAGGTIEGMRHFALSEFESFEPEVSKDKPTIFYCRSGRRSLKAGDIASRWTDQKLYSLAGGYLGYADSND